MKSKLIPLLVFALLFFARLAPHPPNFSPMAAMAILGGYYFPKRWGVILPLATLLASDLFLGFYGAEMFFVYGSFLLIIVLSQKLTKNSLFRIGSLALSGSILFFLITNFGVWLTTNLYPKNIVGLILCYEAAIPFFRNTLLGDLTYTLAFFQIFNVVYYFHARPFCNFRTGAAWVLFTSFHFRQLSFGLKSHRRDSGGQS